MERLLAKEIRAEDDEVVRMHEVLTNLYPSLCATGDSEARALFKKNYPSVDDLHYHMLYKTYSERIKKLQEKFEDLGGKTHLWVGINPPPGKFSMLELYDKMTEIAQRPKISFFRDNFMWNIEQNTKGGVRPHIHLMLLDKKVKPSRVIETLSKAFDIPKSSIECKRNFNNHLMPEHIAYLKGSKTDSKSEDVAKDICDRLDLGIPDYIGEIKI